MANNFLGMYSLARPKVLLNYASYLFNDDFVYDGMIKQYVINAESCYSDKNTDNIIWSELASSEISDITYSGSFVPRNYLNYYVNTYNQAIIYVYEFAGLQLINKDINVYSFNNKYYTCNTFTHSTIHDDFEYENTDTVNLTLYSIFKTDNEISDVSVIPVICKLNKLSYFTDNGIKLKYNTVDSKSKLNKSYIPVNSENILCCVKINDENYLYHDGPETKPQFLAYTADEDGIPMTANINYTIDELYNSKNERLDTRKDIFGSYYGNNGILSEEILFSYITLDTNNIVFDYLYDFPLGTSFKLKIDLSGADYTYLRGEVFIKNLTEEGYSGTNVFEKNGTSTLSRLLSTRSEKLQYYKGKSYLLCTIAWIDTNGVDTRYLPNKYKCGADCTLYNFSASNSSGTGGTQIMLFADSTKTFNLYLAYM